MSKEFQEDHIFLLCSSWENDDKGNTIGYALCDTYGNELYRHFEKIGGSHFQAIARVCAEGLEAVDSLVDGVTQVDVISPFEFFPYQIQNLEAWKDNGWRTEDNEPLPAKKYYRRIYDLKQRFGIDFATGIQTKFSGWHLDIKRFPDKHFYAKKSFLYFILDLEKFRRNEMLSIM